ncbi:MAG: anaerobic ribonucleoside-triphosphate reductase activating protein, partial [Cetobacterium sp.]
MRYSKIQTCDTINSLNGIAVSLWVQGCNHDCVGCFNKDTHDFSGGKTFDWDSHKELIKAMSNPYVTGFSVLGGEPLDKDNIFGVLLIIKEIRKRFPDKTISVWTGYSFEHMKALYSLADIDYIIDGKFIEDLADKKLKFRGSSNQRIFHNKEGK